MFWIARLVDPVPGHCDLRILMNRVCSAHVVQFLGVMVWKNSVLRFCMATMQLFVALAAARLKLWWLWWPHAISFCSSLSHHAPSLLKELIAVRMLRFRLGFAAPRGCFPCCSFWYDVETLAKFQSDHLRNALPNIHSLRKFLQCLMHRLGKLVWGVELERLHLRGFCVLAYPYWSATRTRSMSCQPSNTILRNRTRQAGMSHELAFCSPILLGTCLAGLRAVMEGCDLGKSHWNLAFANSMPWAYFFKLKSSRHDRWYAVSCFEWGPIHAWWQCHLECKVYCAQLEHFGIMLLQQTYFFVLTRLQAFVCTSQPLQQNLEVVEECIQRT